MLAQSRTKLGVILPKTFMSLLQTALCAYPPGTVVTPSMLKDHQDMQQHLDELQRNTADNAARTRARRRARGLDGGSIPPGASQLAG